MARPKWFKGPAERSQISISTCLAVGAVIASLSSPHVTWAAQPAAEIEYVENRLSADFKDTAANAAFSEIERIAGVTIDAPASLGSRRLTISLSDTTVEDAVRQIFRALSVANYAVISNAARDGRQAFIVLDSLDSHSEALPPEDQIAGQPEIQRDEGQRLPDQRTADAPSEAELTYESFVSGPIVEDWPHLGTPSGTDIVAND